MFKAPTFRPIRIDEDGAVAVRFQIDVYTISFGHSQRFFDKFGNQGEGYLKWLRELEDIDPGSSVHLWKDGKIIGQIELGIYKEDPSAGYVYLYYLIPEARGMGVGNLLDEYASNYFSSRGLKKMRLSVTADNEYALRFYKRLGWQVIGEDSRRVGVNLMEKTLDSEFHTIFVP